MDPLSLFLKRRIKRQISYYFPLKDVVFDAIYFDSEKEVMDSSLLLEMHHSPIPGFKKYGFRIDIPFGEQRPGNQKHMHVYVKDHQIFAINADGSAHDGYHNVAIPNEIVPFLKSKGITIPANNIIECIVSPQHQEYLVEQSSISRNQVIELFRGIERIAVVITNKTINHTDVKCNKKIEGIYNHVHLLATVPESLIDAVLQNIQNIITESGHKIEIMEIKNSYYISEDFNVYLALFY